ncbi:MAG: GAF domain-containing protein [Thermonemataceae bacterium]
MKDRFQNPAIRNSIIAVFLLFSVALFINYLLTSYFFSEIEEGQYLVNIAGKNRTLSQRILITSQRVAKGNENLKVTLNDLIVEHSIILKALKTGGDVKIEGQSVHISHEATGTLLNAIKQAERYWQNEYKKPAETIVTAPLYVVQQAEATRDTVESIFDTDLEALAQINVTGERALNPAITEALAQISDKADDMLLLNEQLVEAYLEELDLRRRNADTLVLLLTIGNILFLALSYWGIRKVVLNPLYVISKAAEDISEGNLDQQIDYERNNEVGAVSKALNRMVSSLQNATSFIQNIGRGELDTHYKGIVDTEEVEKSTLAGSLLEMRERMREVAEEENQRKWATEGLGLFVDILRENNDDIQKLSYEVISSIVKYIDALQGGLYILEEDDEEKTFAALVACYAFGKQKFLKQKIYPGEGVVGQVLREGDRVYINDVPEDYSDIASGLGGANPRCVLIVPLKLNDQLLGLVELASFHEIAPYQIEFLERLANNVASTLANAKVNEATKRLLEEQQVITQEMRIKEEELLQNMEELQATQEEMRRNEKALYAQSYAMSTTLISAEYDMEAHLLSANEQFLAYFNYNLSDIKGKHHRFFLDTESAYSDAYVNFWEDLQAGKIQSGEYKRITKNGEELWLRATYVPILDTDNVPFKVIC